MSLFTGFFQGATVVRLCTAGHRVINATLQSGSVFKGETNADLVLKLHRLALKDRVSHLKVRPRKSLLMPSSSDLNINGTLSRLCSDAQDVVSALEKRAQSRANGSACNDPAVEELREFPRICSDSEDAGEVAAFEAATAEELDVTDQDYATNAPADVLIDEVGNDVDQAIGSNSWNLANHNLNIDTPFMENGDISINDTNPRVGEVEHFRDIVQNSLGDEIFSGANEFIDPCDLFNVTEQADMMGLASRKPIDGERHEEASLAADGLGAELGVFACTPVSGGNTPSGSRDPGMSVNFWDLEGGGNGSTESAGGVGMDSESGSQGGPERKRRRVVRQGQENLTEEEKAEIRKKRNREAAARSNLKRKIRNESVRRDLAVLTQQAVRLRVKETMLRDENTRLRNALRAARISIVSASSQLAA